MSEPTNGKNELRHPIDAQRLADHVAGQAPILLELDPGIAFAVVGFLQLAMRHEGAKQMNSWQSIRQLTDSIIERLAAGDAGILDLLCRGDDPAHDCPP